MTQVNAVMVATRAEADTKFPKNRISHQGADYDNAGNMIQLEGRPVAYDFEGRITKMTASTGSTSSEERLWFYDGEGRRVREEHWAVAGSARTLQWETVFVYDPLGALVAEYDTRSPGTAGIRYLTVDHLGSTRMVTKESGTTEAQVVDTRHDYLPFGEEVRSTGGPKEKFTGKERADVVGTRVDYFGARYMSAMLGRFTSPDAFLHTHTTDEEGYYSYLANPQNWNRYTYGLNSPLIYVDPDGNTVYLILYSTGWHGEEDFKRAAETRGAEIEKRKDFDPKKDKVLVRGVKTKDDVKAAISEANGLNDSYGKVGELSLYSHAGPVDGPQLRASRGEAGPNPGQYSVAELSSLSVNWDPQASARFYGCRTAPNFCQRFSDAQGVASFGYQGFAYFSSSPTRRTGPQSSGPLYLIYAPGYHNGGNYGAVQAFFGLGFAIPMTRFEPRRPTR